MENIKNKIETNNPQGCINSPNRDLILSKPCGLSLSKRCWDCKSILPIQMFSNDKTHKDGKSYRCKECGKKYIKNYIKTHKEYWKNWYKKNKKYIRKYRKKNRVHYLKYSKEWNTKHKEYTKGKAKNKRIQVINHYGGKCICCGENKTEFLAIDHIGKTGAEHRKKIKISIYSYLIKNNYPENVRILCHNCNMSLGFYGYCPHNKYVNL